MAAVKHKHIWEEARRYWNNKLYCYVVFEICYCGKARGRILE